MTDSREGSTAPTSYPEIILGTPASVNISPSYTGNSMDISSPILRATQPIDTTFRTNSSDLLSDPFTTQSPTTAPLFTAHRPFNQNRKRGPSTTFNHQNKHQKTYTKPSTAKEAILEARDLIILASSLSQSRDEQTKLLDLLEIFREYTEKGRLTTASNIITSQITHLESATRKIESQAKALAKTPLPTTSNNNRNPQDNQPITKPVSYAAVATQGNKSTTNTQEWTVVNNAKADKPFRGNKKAEMDKRRLILIQSKNTNSQPFSSLSIRNQINTAFEEAGILGPVIISVSKTLNENIVITTSESFTAQFLLEKKSIWNHLIQFSRIQRDQTWYKVILHTIPIIDFSGPEGMDLIKAEIKTFNRDLNPIGNPYWLTTAEKRATKRAGSVVVAFATEQEAKKAIQNRLYIAGVSVRVEKYYSTAPSTQCQRCQGFGHHESYCKREITCGLCGETHNTKQHYCNICQIKGGRCPHLAPKCANCNEAHTANTRSCEVLLAIKQKATDHRAL